ncbi:MAG: hypothetical protein EA379_07205 [Phycisphaerales bacterium]|nr:MAG: hypothetical protein EA379_07205 [Phycisphaerales bacterium]
MTERTHTHATAAIRAALLVCLLLCFGASSAPAQWLDLESARPPEIGDRGVLPESEESLSDEIEFLRNLPPDGRGLDADAIDARVAWRELALALLRAGRPRGDAGLVPVDAGLRLRRELPALDALVEDALQAAADDESERERVASALRASARAARLVEAQTILEWSEADGLLRDVFLGLGALPGAWRDEPPGAAWPDPGETPPVDAPGLRAAVRAMTDDEGVIAGAQAAIATLALADASPAFRAAARAEAATIRAALAAPGVLDSLPWREAELAEAWRRRALLGVQALGADESREQGRRVLRRLAQYAELASATADAAHAGADERALRGLLHAGVGGVDGGVAMQERTLSVTIEALRACTRGRAILRDGRITSRDVRVGFRVQSARAEEALFARLTQSVGDRDALESPATLSALVALRTAHEGVARYTKAQTWPDAIVAMGGEVWGDAADGLRRALTAHVQDDSRAWGVRRLERFDRVFSLRENLQDRDIAHWLQIWLRADNTDDEPAAALERIASAVAAVRTLRDDRRRAALRAWSALGFDATDVEHERVRALAVFERGGDARRAPEQTAVVRALAALCGVWGSSEPVALDTADRPSDALLRLTHTPPRNGALTGERDDLARFSRWFAELSLAERTGDAAIADDARLYLAAVCERLIADAARARPGAQR